MKRLILFSVLSLLFFSSCDSPIGNFNNNKDNVLHPDQVQGGIPPGTPPAKAYSIRKMAWNQFKKSNGQDWEIRWSKKTDLPRSMFSGVTDKKYRGKASQAARAFLADHSRLFGFASSKQLKHKKTRTNDGIRHVTFNQMVDGVPVYEAQYQVHIRPNGRVDMANGIYYPDINISTSPSISKAQARNTALADLNTPQGTDPEVTAELVIYPQKDRFRLAWKLILSSENPLTDWLYFVDANSGTILHKFNRLMSVTGDGDVYPTHPGLSSVTNKSLYRLNDSGYLQGDYAYVVNDDGSEAQSASYSFQYNPGNMHFDEVNLYYHIDDFRVSFINGIGGFSLNFTQITAHAHTPIQDLNGDGYLDPNAWFNSTNQNLYFNDEYAPAGTNDFAKEDKVIYHEYGHAVIYDIQSGIESTNDEEGAISEGTPDYWAGSFTNRSVIGDYVGFERDMENPEYDQYDDLPTDGQGNINVGAHDGGEFFSSILWDLRDNIGANATDELVFDALFRITSNPDFLSFRNAMMAADNATNGGEFQDAIQTSFAANGVSLPSLNVSISGPGQLDKGDTGTWNANVNDGNAPYDYIWYYKPNGGFWNVVGSNSPSYSKGTGNGKTDFRLKVQVSDTDSRLGTATQHVTVGIFDPPKP